MPVLLDDAVFCKICRFIHAPVTGGFCFEVGAPLVAAYFRCTAPERDCQEAEQGKYGEAGCFIHGKSPWVQG